MQREDHSPPPSRRDLSSPRCLALPGYWSLVTETRLPSTPWNFPGTCKRGRGQRRSRPSSPTAILVQQEASARWHEGWAREGTTTAPRPRWNVESSRGPSCADGSARRRGCPQRRHPLPPRLGDLTHDHLERGADLVPALPLVMPLANLPVHRVEASERGVGSALAQLLERRVDLADKSLGI